jgi:hypothetical protein
MKLCLKKYLDFFVHCHLQIRHFKLHTVRNRIAMLSLLSYALAGFEPGSSALQVNAVTIAPRRHRN